MPAWVIHQFGNNSELTLTRSYEVPYITDPQELIILIHAASINPIDVLMRGGYGKVSLDAMKAVNKERSGFPLVLGRDCSGIVIHTGQGVHKFKEGDEVMAAPAAFKAGTHAQYVLVHQDEAASIPYVALTTWSALCHVGGLTETTTTGKRILIPAGSGGIGSFAIQLMKAWGAHVTTTCSTDAVAMVKSLGADVVIDYKTQDVQTALGEMEKFDVLYECLEGFSIQSKDVLKSRSYAQCISITTPLLKYTDMVGVVLGIGLTTGQLVKKQFEAFTHGHNFRWAYFRPNGSALQVVADMIADHDIIPVVDEVFPFGEVPEAFAKVEKRHARGKTVIEFEYV